VVLRGSFAVDSDGRLGAPPPELCVGDIRVQGFPFFAGTAIYEKSFDWSGPAGPALFRCGSARDLAEVVLDGVSLGRRAWGRRAFGADNLAPGRHLLQVRTTNTLGATLRRFYNAELNANIPPSGLMSPVEVFALKR